jgi:hypothetical protein
MAYDPLTGDGWDQATALSAWASSMNRSQPRWTLQGMPREWIWRFFNWRNWEGLVTVEADGFHWRTIRYGTDETLHEGVTTSVYEAYQSVEQNKVVKR